MVQALLQAIGPHGLRRTRDEEAGTDTPGGTDHGRVLVYVAVHGRIRRQSAHRTEVLVDTPQLSWAVGNQAGAEFMRALALQLVEDGGKLRQVLGLQGEIAREIILACERVRVRDIDREKRHLLRAKLAREPDEQRQLAIVGPLQRYSYPDSAAQVCRSADALAHLVKRIETANRLIGPRIRAVERHGDRVKELCRAARMLRERESGGQQPQPQTLTAQQLR